MAFAAQEREPNTPGVKVIRDVPYGPHGAGNLLDVYLPEAGPTSRPLVLCIHGGGWAGGDKRGYAALGQVLARKGFAAAALTYHFAPAWRAPAQMDDVQRAVRWLVTYVAKHAPPFLILHGTRDVGTSRGQVPMEQSVACHEKPRKAGADAALIKVEGAGHGFNFGGPNPENQKALAATLDFFAKHWMKRE